MFYVYFIQSISFPEHTYVGYTTNIKNRLEAHNSNYSRSTSNHGPWKLVVCIAFENMKKAKDFEKYLKSHAGKAFAQKRLW